MLPPFVSSLPDGVSRSGLPTPFRVGHVNCYLLTDLPVTLIDPGTLEPGSLEALDTFLREQGLRFTDVEQVVITHAHPDHFGPPQSSPPAPERGLSAGRRNVKASSVRGIQATRSCSCVTSACRRRSPAAS